MSNTTSVNWLHIVERNVKAVAANRSYLGCSPHREVMLSWLDGSLNHNVAIANQIERQMARYVDAAREAVLCNESAIHGQIRMAVSNLAPDEVGEFQRDYQRQHQCSTAEWRR